MIDENKERKEVKNKMETEKVVEKLVLAILLLIILWHVVKYVRSDWFFVGNWFLNKF